MSDENLYVYLFQTLKNMLIYNDYKNLKFDEIISQIYDLCLDKNKKYIEDILFKYEKNMTRFSI